ncbi:MAG TPA: response regulator, partial [Polyangiaceae bacterium]|nr:response regulator [Polyangiaceae bacterium]
MSNEKPCVLLVDDDAAVRTVLAALLRQGGIEAIEAASASEALTFLNDGVTDVMVTDLRMPGMDGMELLARASKTWPDVPVIMLTAHGNVPLAVEAMRQGAFEFLLKPF